MAVRRDDVQLHIDFITDESRALARTLQTTKAYNAELAQSQAKIAQYNKELAQTNITEAKRAELLAKVAAEEKKVATNLAQIAAEGKKVENLDLSKVTPAQMNERARQLAQILRNIPPSVQQSVPQFAAMRRELDAITAKTKELKAVGASTGGGGIFGTVFGVAGGLGVFELVRQGIRSLFTFGRQAVAEVDAQLKADAQIKEAIRSTGGVAGKSLEELKRQAEELQKVTLFGDEQTEGAQALLLTFKNIRGEIFDETVPLVQDLATAFKQDLSSSAIQVGKALEDPIRGVTALRRVGITFSEDQQRMIKTLVETGRTADAQRIILKELESQVGGSARAAAQAGAGPWQQFKLIIGEVREFLGGVAINLVSGVLPALRSVADAFLDLVSIPLSEKLEEERQAFNGIATGILNAEVGTRQRTEAIKKLQQQYPAYLGNLDAEKVSNEELRPILDKINQLYIVRIALQKQQEKIQPFLEAEAEAATDLAEKRAEYNRQLARGTELAGLSGQVFASQAEQIEKVTAALRKQIAERGFSFFPKEDQVVLSRILNEGAIEQAIGRQENAARRVTEAEKQRQAVIEEIRKTYGDIVDAATAFESATGGGGENEDGLAGGLKKDAEAAAGSLAFLRQQISDLQGQIENTPGDSKALAPLIRQLNEAEKALKILEDRIASLKNPPQDTPPTDEEIARALGIPTAEQARELSEEQRVALVEFNDFRLEDEILTLEGINQAREALSDEDLRRIEERRQAELSIAESVAGALFQIEGNRFEQQNQAALEALDAEYAAKIKAAEGNSREQARLQKELEQKKAVIERDAARKRKEIALKEAVIQGALAVVKALPNVAAAIAASVAAAAQIAIISSQKFARGGYTGRGYGAPDSTGFRPAGVVHEGEYVVPKRIVEDRSASPLIHYLEQKRLRGYADGGFVNTTPVPLPSLSPAGANVFGQIETLNEAVLRFEKVVAQFPTEVKSRVVYTELEEVGAELNSVRDDAAI